MIIDTILSGAHTGRNDDHVAVFDHAGTTDILVVDGATSVAAHDHVDPVRGDVAWFVHAFTAELRDTLAPGRPQDDCVHAALERVRATFERMPGAADAPPHASPIAAMTWLRIAGHDGAWQASLYSLGDCKTLLRTARHGAIDPDPFTNPQENVLQAEIDRLRAAGVHDGDARRERMLPLLRARRASQNTAPQPSVLCLRPRGRLAARTRSFPLDAGSTVLVMSDGFYRLVDPYRLYTDAGLIDACLDRGLPAMLEALRAHEGGSDTASRAVKAADDASAVLWRAQ